MSALGMLKLAVWCAILGYTLVQWHAWVAVNDQRALCVYRGTGWVMIDGQCVAGSRRRGR